ncbi:MAG: hypothetical protein QF738_09990 [Rhodospirillales bacterium]|nr:hypothetical protein [Rhodospirillales bacterium]
MMDEMMNRCCADGGKPDFAKMKAFMERCGERRFDEGELAAMRNFCGDDEMTNFEKMKQFLDKCGCRVAN